VRDYLESKFGRLDVLVNNAGIITDTKAGGLVVSLAIVRETLETNTLTPLRRTQMLLPLPGLMGAKPNTHVERPRRAYARERSAPM
jgi:short-subunit dehydrogenase involved in D-alanine esterification of teichoic acids